MLLVANISFDETFTVDHNNERATESQNAVCFDCCTRYILSVLVCVYVVRPPSVLISKGE